MDHSLDEALAKVGTDKAKQEFENRRNMAKEDEKEIYHPERIAKEELMRQGETNFALLNFILTSHSFQHCHTKMDAIRTIHQHDLVHIRRVARELKFFRDICEKYNLFEKLEPVEQTYYKEYIANDPDPVHMAQVALEKVAELSRQRSKANKYGIVTGKKAENELRSRIKPSKFFEKKK